MDIILRRAVPADAAALSTIAKQTFYDTFIDTCTAEDMQDFLEQYFNEAQLKAELSDENDYCFFAELNGMPVGYIRFKEDYESFELMRQWKSLELKRIYILKEYKGKGPAFELMQLFFDHAAQGSYQAIFLGVWEHNLRAQRFYEKYGFVNSGHMHDFPIGKTPQQDYWFWKFL
ncbi:MAG: GNAT family N-acetyltransferase [Ferruginibacter sp.]